MKKILILFLALFLLLVGCSTPNNGDNNNGNDNNDNNNGDTDNGNTDDGKTGSVVYYEEIKVSVEDAYDMYKDKYPDAKINEIEFEYKHNTYEYEIEGYDGTMEYEMKIDAISREILDESSDHESDEHGEISRDQLADIDKYLKLAFEDAGEGYFLDEWKLKVKDDYVKFEVELKADGKKVKYKYDFETGELLEKH